MEKNKNLFFFEVYNLYESRSRATNDDVLPGGIAVEVARGIKILSSWASLTIIWIYRLDELSTGRVPQLETVLEGVGASQDLRILHEKNLKLAFQAFEINFSPIVSPK